MRLSIVIKFARVLMISRLRSTRRSFVSNSITNRPLLIVVLGIVLLVAATFAGLALVWFLGIGRVSPGDVQQLVISVIGGGPLFLVGFYFTMGLLWELNASTEAESTDAVNWLPISPSEYVAASSLSTWYTYSPVLMGFLGFSFPIAMFSSNLTVIALLVPVAFVSATTGSIGVEVLRSALARTSTAFSRVGGRKMILLRILGIMSILVLTQILFSGFIIASIIGTIVAGADVVSFVPFLWPTLALTKAMSSDPLSSGVFLALGLGFAALLARIALSLRSRYWLVFPSALHLSGPGSISRPGKLGRLGFGPKFLALLRREIRSATRRKEAIRLTVIPIIIPLMIGFPLVFAPTTRPEGGGNGGFVSAVLGVPFLIGVSLGALLLSMTSLGQEGKGLWNLAALPVEASALVIAKAAFAVLVSSLGLALAAVAAVLLFGLALASLTTFLILGLTLISVEAALGVAIGSRFPDFSEGPRPKFVTVTGSIVGTVLGFFFMGITVSPLVAGIALEYVYGVDLPSGFYVSISAALGLLITWTFYRLALGPVSRILSELPA